jgi:hypothetical protein
MLRTYWPPDNPLMKLKHSVIFLLLAANIAWAGPFEDALIVSGSAAIASNQVFKCVADGSVTFQSSPCPVDKPTRPPTKDELNAERKKRLAEAVSDPRVVPQTAPTGNLQPAPREPLPNREAAFRCDGRQHCSQMRSCTEAKYFLANCTGVKMDGNRDGTPCEQQWCTHPFAK